MAIRSKANPLGYKEEKEKRFQVLEHYEEYLAELESRFAACRKKLDEQAEALTRIRKKAAVRFQSRSARHFRN